MKRAVFLMLGSAMWFVLSPGTAAFADNGPHVNGLSIYTAENNNTANPVTDRCSGCHRAHTAQGPDITIDEQPALCYTCHGAGGAGASTDVQEGNAYTAGGAEQAAAGALRGGGFDSAWIASGDFSNTIYPYGTGFRTKNKTIPVSSASAPSTSSHLIGVSGTMWGNTAEGAGQTGVVLECTSCHDPHGNGNYRILKPIPDSSGAVDPGVVIKDTLTSSKVYTLTDYWLGNSKADGSDGNATTSGPQLGVSGDQVFQGTTDGTGAWVSQTGGVPTTTLLPSVSKPLDGFIQNIANWCTTCHTSYNTGTLGGAAPVTEYSNAMFKYRHDGTNNKYGSPNCIVCHVAHGSNADMTGANSSRIPLPDGEEATHNGVPSSRLLRFDNASCSICHAK